MKVELRGICRLIIIINTFWSPLCFSYVATCCSAPCYFLCVAERLLSPCMNSEVIQEYSGVDFNTKSKLSVINKKTTVCVCKQLSLVESKWSGVKPRGCSCSCSVSFKQKQPQLEPWKFWIFVCVNAGTKVCFQMSSSFSASLPIT